MPAHSNKIDVLADESDAIQLRSVVAIGGDTNSPAAVALTAADEQKTDRKCGACGLYPTCLQPFADRRAFLVFFSLKNVLQAMVFTYLVAVQTSVERHFHFSSQQFGILPSIGELGPILTAVCVSHVASNSSGRFSRPFWMAIGVATIVVGLLCGLASHLLVPPPPVRDHLASSRRLCVLDNVTASHQRDGQATCTIDSASSYQAYLLWAAQYFLIATGTITIFTISAPYLDDGVSHKNSPLYFALGSAARILGPVAGYLLASVCVKLNDPRWIGAWWLGLLIIASVLFLYAGVVALFPDSLSPPPQKQQQQHQKCSNGDNEKVTLVETSESSSLTELRIRVYRLLQNPVLMASSVATTAYFMGLIGFYSYQPKYIEHVFRIDKAASASYASVSKVSLLFGIIGSGAVMRHWQPSAHTVTKSIAAARLCGTIPFVVLLFIRCPFENDLPGVREQDRLQIDTPCNQQCFCSTEEYIPVCHRWSRDHYRSFFSPCHAGCLETVSDTTNATYTHCRCLGTATENNITGIASLSNLSTVTSGLCESSAGCGSQFIAFLVAVTLSGLIQSTVAIPHFIIVLRCVSASDKAVALGLGGAISSLAFGLGPLAAGTLVDSTCLVWERSCHVTGACWVYDTYMFRYRIVGFVMLCWLLSFAADVVVFLKCGSLQLYGCNETKAEPTETNGAKRDSNTVN